MRAWWAVAVFAVIAQCGGSSVRRGPSGDGDGTQDGGTSGSTGARGGAAGTSTAGATNPSGGRGGGGATTAGGGRFSSGGIGGTSAGDGGDGGDAAFGGDAGSGGSAGEPTCDEDLVASTCSPEDTCELLECGAPWSFFDARRCRRTECTETGTCPAGERCVPAPVLGKYDDPCSYGWDSCEHDLDGTCFCSYWEECMPRALCVPEDEFPPSRDCPIEDFMDCAGLSGAVATLEAYRDGTQFFFPYVPPPALASSVDACAERLAAFLLAECD